MKQIRLLLILLFFVKSFINAQPNFITRYASTFPSVSVAANGDYLLTGLQWNGSLKVPFYRIDGDGNTIWTKEFSLGSYSLRKAAETSAHDILIPCQWIDSSQMKSYAAVMKLDSAGDLLWTKYIQSSPGLLVMRFLLRTSDDYNVIAFNDSAYNLLVIKFDDDANIIWSKSFSYLQPGYAMVTENGSFLLSQGWALYKITSTGDTAWTKQFQENGSYVSLRALKLLPGGGYLFGGHSYYGSSHGVLIKTGTDGNVVWSQNYLFPDTILSNYPLVAPEPGGNNFLIMQRISFGETIVIKTDSSGTPLWAEKASFAYILADDMQATTDGGFILTGDIIDSIPTLYNGLVLKSDSAGSILSCFDPVSVSSSSISVTTIPGYITFSNISYPFVDASVNATPGIVYSQNGCLPTAVPAESHTKFSVFPSPSDDILLVSTEEQSGNFTIDIFSITGQKLLTQEAPREDSHPISVNVSSLPGGFYLLKISGKGFISLIKFIK